MFKFLSLCRSLCEGETAAGGGAAVAVFVGAVQVIALLLLLPLLNHRGKPSTSPNRRAETGSSSDDSV